MSIDECRIKVIYRILSYQMTERSDLHDSPFDPPQEDHSSFRKFRLLQTSIHRTGRLQVAFKQYDPLCSEFFTR